MKGLSKYDRYRDSGVEWLGEVPEHWEVKKLSRICVIKGRIGWRGYTVDDLRDKWEGKLVLGATHITQNGTIDLSKASFLSVEKYAESPEIQLSGEELLMVKVGATIGKVGYFPSSYGDATINPNLMILKFYPNLFSKFIWYLFLSKKLKEKVRLESAAGAQDAINQEMVSRLQIPMPPLSEQQAIADYLDAQTERIDTLLAKKEAFLVRLAEKRQALITQAVTRGLDPNAPTRPSGLPWLGDIPAHWRIIKLGHYSEVHNGSTPKRDESEYWERGTIPWLSSGKVNESIIEAPSEFITAQAQADTSLRLFPINTVMIGLVGQGKTRGTTSITAIETTINQNMAGIVTNEVLSSHFLYFYLTQAYEQIRNIAQGGNQQALNCELIKSVKLPHPPLLEQQTIVAHIEQETDKLDLLTEKTKAAMERLREYRQALITACVTGQVKVPGVE